MTELTPQEERQLKIEAIKIIEELDRRKKHRKLYSLYPDKGPLRRELYKPHMAFFAAGAKYRERCAIAANRVGKSYGMGGFETAVHLTGLYPKWWTGKVFKNPVFCIAAGKTSQTVRDIGQEILCGPPHAIGTGLIPKEFIIDIKKKAGNIADAIEQVLVRHRSGGTSRLVYKSYDQKRQAFEGIAPNVLWLDEECIMGIYSECLIRTMTTDGILMLTFTPKLGITEVVENFLPDGKMPGGVKLPDGVSGGAKGTKFVVQATWEDAPHLTQQQKDEIYEGTPKYLRDAVSKGIPQLGEGAIYPILEEDVICPYFDVNEFPWWPRVYAIDVGWRSTAGVWGVLNTESDIVYLYDEYKQGQQEPMTHVRAFNSRGDWIPGVIDPAAKQRSQKDGKRLIDDYRELGLELHYADNSVDAGIARVKERLFSGRLKVFPHLSKWLSEFRMYRYGEDGKPERNQDDHLMDCTRYLIMSGLDVASRMPYEDEENYFNRYNQQSKPKKDRRLSLYGIF